MKKIGLLMLVAMLIGAVVCSPALAAAPAEGDVTPANASYLVLPAVAITVTNGEEIALAASHYSITASESATITLTAPTAAQEGMVVLLTEPTGVSYHWTIADSGTAQLAGSFTASTNDSQLILIAQSNIWVQGLFGLTSASTLDVAGAGTVGGTLAVTGVATFTAESVHNGGIDADYVTVDAGAGVDTKTAGALAIGAVTATSLALGASDITTSVAGPLTAPRISATAYTNEAYVLTSAFYGTWYVANTNAAVALTLPANGAAIGSWIGVAVHGSATDDCAPTVSAATADTLIGPNDVDLDSVTWGTGHRIGAQAIFWSDGSFWHVRNLGGTTMTYTD